MPRRYARDQQQGSWESELYKSFADLFSLWSASVEATGDLTFACPIEPHLEDMSWGAMIDQFRGSSPPTFILIHYTIKTISALFFLSRAFKETPGYRNKGISYDSLCVDNSKTASKTSFCAISEF